jgi:hypothetical protein
MIMSFKCANLTFYIYRDNNKCLPLQARNPPRRDEISTQAFILVARKPA